MHPTNKLLPRKLALVLVLSRNGRRRDIHRLPLDTAEKIDNINHKNVRLRASRGHLRDPPAQAADDDQAGPTVGAKYR